MKLFSTTEYHGSFLTFRPSPGSRRPPPSSNSNNDRGRLPPIQQPPRDRNDVIGIPNAVPPTIQDNTRPQRRPIRPGLRPQTRPGPIRPTPSILDQIPTDDDDVSVIDGVWPSSPPPLVIPIQTDNPPFVTNTAGGEINATPPIFPPRQTTILDQIPRDPQPTRITGDRNRNEFPPLGKVPFIIYQFMYIHV